MPSPYLRVCIIEDDEPSAELLQEVVRMAFPEATVMCTLCIDVASALRELVKVRFDLITLDLFLPQLSGLAALSLVHGYAPVTPIVVISGAELTLEHLEHYGVALTVQKPFRVEGLAAELVRLVAQAPSHQVLPPEPVALLSQEILSYRLLYTIFLDLPDAVLITDGTTILGCNKQVSLLSGYHVSELLGHPVDLLVPVGQRAGHAQQRGDYLRQPYPRTRLSLALQHKGGQVIPVTVTLAPCVELVGLRVVVTIRREADRTEVKGLRTEPSDPQSSVLSTQSSPRREPQP